MRLLWLCPYVPAPVWGAGTRVFNLLKRLSATCEIDLLAGSVTGEPDEAALADLRSMCRTVQIVPPSVESLKHKRLLQLRSLVSRYPMQYRIFHSVQMQDRIDHALAQTTYDVVLLEHSYMGYYSIPQQVPTVLDQHNVESEVLARSSRHERSALRRVYNLLEYRKYRSQEQRACRTVSLIVAASDRDREAMLRWEGVPGCVVIPNGVDTIFFAPIEEARARSTVLFTGAMNYAPNAEAMLYFCAETWPLIRQQIPEAQLQIVGMSPPAEVLRLGKLPGVTVEGTVPDVRPYLARAQVIVAPLRIGGGTRLKILEAMAMARPVVSTSLGCEGLEVQSGRHLLIADTPKEFASSVVNLLTDPQRGMALGREGRCLVEESYAWDALGIRLETALRGLLHAQQVLTKTPGDESSHSISPESLGDT